MLPNVELPRAKSPDRVHEAAFVGGLFRLACFESEKPAPDKCELILKFTPQLPKGREVEQPVPICVNYVDNATCAGSDCYLDELFE